MIKLMSVEKTEFLRQSDSFQNESVKEELASAQREIAALKKALLTGGEKRDHLSKELQQCKDDLAKCCSERDELQGELVALRQKRSSVALPNEEDQNLADKVSELEQENIVLGAMYRNACRKLERLEGTSDKEHAPPMGAAESGDTSPKQQNLNESALPLEECRKLCPQTSVKRRTEEWVLQHSWAATQPDGGGKVEGSSVASTDHGFLSGSMSWCDDDEEEAEEEGQKRAEEEDALRGRVESVVPMSSAMQMTGYRGNPVNRVARAAWKKTTAPGYAPKASNLNSASPAGPPGGYADVLGSLLGGMGKATKRREVDVAVFDP